MARIKKFAGDIPLGLSSYQTFIVDDNPNSQYFKITEFKNTFTGGKNGFLIEGSPYLRETTEVKIEILDVDGNPVYFEPGDGIPEYYEGTSKVVAVYIYEDTPIGSAKITILGELKQYLDGQVVRNVPSEWQGVYNVKWEKEFTINKNLTNEDKVRFYRRPDVSITEIARPIFTANPISVTQTGNVLGTPIIPAPGTNLSQFPRPSQYLLTTLDNTRWTGSVVNSTITLTDTGESLIPLEVVSDTELIVSTPYTENGLVVSFPNKPYSTTFNYLQNEEGLGTALSGSFGKFVITNLETFVGDVARVKVFRTSQADLTDFQFVQEIVLESTELLIDYESSQRDEEYYGLFTPYVISNYWATSSNDLSVEFNQSKLFNSTKLDSTGTNTFHTKNSISITNGLEYTVSFNVKVDSVNSGDTIEVYLQGTNNGINRTIQIATLNSSSTFLQKSYQEFNFKGQSFDSNAKLYFKVKGSGWYISTVSLRAAQESSFSPDEITFIQTVPRTLEQETFDFRFEFYDINNNYIPVTVTATKTFSAGNLNEIQKNIEIVPTSLYFQFDSGSQQGNALPPKAIFFDINKQFLTGSTNFTSGAYDNNNNLLSASEYSSTFYPGLLEEISTDRYRLTVESFSGSIYDNVIQYITYTAECEGVTDNVTISRLADGKGGVNFDIRPFRGTLIRNSDPTSSVEIQTVRIDGINETNLRAGLPLDYSVPLLYVVSASLEGNVSYITLEEASSSGYIIGLTAGKTGSKEINYNAEFNRDAIDGQRTIYLIPSTTPVSESILTSLTLTDLQDGLNTGEIAFTVDAFTVSPYPSFQNTSLARTFNPTTSAVTGSFFRRGQTTSPISGTLDIYPSMSLNTDYNPTFWLYYETGAFNEDVGVVVTDENKNVIQPQNPLTSFDGSSRNGHKQLNVAFTYYEPFSTASVTVEKTFTIVPEGKSGDDAIVIEVEPKSLALQADESRTVSDYSPTATSIRVKQGNGADETYLTYQEAKAPGTFFINIGNLQTQSIQFNGIQGSPEGTTTFLSEPYSNMTDSPDTRIANVIYPVEIRPFFTSSYYTASISQSITRIDDGAGARSVVLQADSTTVTYNGDGNIVEPIGDITLTATSFNTTGSNYFFFYKDNSFIDIVYQNSTTVTKAIPSSEFPAGGVTQTYRVELHDGNNDSLVAPNAAASITVIGVQDGVPNYQGIVTNQNGVATVDVYENLNFDNTATTIEAYKGQTKLTAISQSFSFPQFDDLGNVIPNGEYRVSIHSYPSDYIDISGSLISGSVLPVDGDGNAYLGPLDNWTNFRNPDLTPNSSSAAIVFRIDFEDGRDSSLVRQNLSVQYEGNVGPGLIMRGEWTGSLDYIYNVSAKRRDAVFREISGDVHYWATTIDLVDAGSPPFTYQPVYTGTEQAGDIDAGGWQYLGIQDFFVAAKLAIFEESFVKNTINVGNNPGNEFANIVLAGGRVDPYMAIGQNGTVGASGDQTTTGVIGYDRAGIFMGTYDDGVGNKTPRFSLRNTAGDKYLRWNSQNLEILATNFSLDASGNLSVTGTINANNGTFSNDITVSGRLNASNMKFGIDVSGSNDGLFINNNNYWYTDGTFSVGGAGGTMVFSAANGSININDTFIVNQDGSLNATAGTFSGNIISSNADIGGWTVGEKEIASKGGNIIFTGAVGEESIVVKDTDGVAKLSVDTLTSLPSLTGGSTFGPSSGNLGSSLTYQNYNYQTYAAQIQTQDLYDAVATFNCGADGDYDVNFETSPAASYVLYAGAAWNGSFATITLFAQIYNNTDGVVIFQSQVGTLTVTDSYPYGSTTGTAITGTISRSGRVAMVNGKQYIFRYYTRISLTSYGTFGSVGYTFSEALRASLNYTVSAIVSRVGTFINGGGFQTLKDGNTYLRFNGGLASTLYDVGAVNGFNQMAVRTDIGGGLGVDKIWTPGNSMPATSITTGNTSGYTKLTNGMVIQFGRYSAGGIGSNPTITFPLTFTRVYSASVHTNRSTSGSNGYNHIETLGTASMDVVVDSSDGACWWIAIGYVE